MDNAQAWNQQFTQDFFAEHNIMSMESLSEIRYRIYVVFPVFKWVGLEYDPNSTKLIIQVKFRFWKSLFRSKKKTLKKLGIILHERFPNMDIDLQEVK